MSHILKASNAQKAPKHVIFLDTETTGRKTSENYEDHALRLGFCISTQRDRSGSFKPTEQFEFHTKAQFQGWITRICSGDKRYYIVGHNIAFDARILGLTKYLTRAGWERKSLIMQGLNFMVRYKKGKSTILIMNNQQLFPTSLKVLGESIGVLKGEVDFANVDDLTLMTYCRQDVEIMRVAWDKWYAYITDNDLGNFQHTVGSQALSAFRHRFMDGKVFIHTHSQAIALERESYHGGRVECFRIGTFTDGPYYNLDINSMYPYVMKHYKVPTKLYKYYERIGLRDFAWIRKNYGYIVEATLRIEKPLLPAERRGRLVFPIGEVSGVFTKPELEHALIQGTLLSVSRCALYTEESIFSRFVDFFYDARSRFKAAGNDSFAGFSKLILNSLYGKFGQQIDEWRFLGLNPDLGDDAGTTYDLTLGRQCKYRRLDGISEISVGEREGYNAFPAIASYITAAARVHLAKIIDQAGWSNVLYCDTDSVFVNQDGYDLIKGFLDPSTLGKLKVEAISKDVSLFGPKRYRFGDKERSKGIRKDAITIGYNTYMQTQFESFAGAMRNNRTDTVRISTVKKVLKDEYHKGIVTSTGEVRPFVFPEERE